MYFLVTEMVPNVPVNGSAEHNHDLYSKNPKSQNWHSIVSLVPLMSLSMADNPIILGALPSPLVDISGRRRGDVERNLDQSRHSPQSSSPQEPEPRW